MKHGSKANSPPLLLARRSSDKYWSGPVKLLSQRCIPFAAEHWAGQRVGVYEAEFLWGQGEAAARVGQLAGLSGKADELGGLSLA